MFFDTNSTTTSSTFVVRKNGGDASQGFAVPNATTGWFEDTTRIDYFLPTDLLSYVRRGGTSGSIHVAQIVLTENSSTLPPILMGAQVT
jgi:hypothetical protein